MADISPDRLVLRCYGHQIKGEKWYGVCVDLNLAAEASSQDDLKKKLRDMIESYIDTVLETDDKQSVPYLLTRKAPLWNWFVYYLIKIIITIRQFPGNFTFKEAIPFHLAHGCS